VGFCHETFNKYCDRCRSGMVELAGFWTKPAPVPKDDVDTKDPTVTQKTPR
jgi:hypothetical protein